MPSAARPSATEAMWGIIVKNKKCELLLDVGYTQVVGQSMEHLANETIKGVMTHVVGPDTTTRRSESRNVTVQRTRAPISTDSPSGNRV